MTTEAPETQPSNEEVSELTHDERLEAWLNSDDDEAEQPEGEEAVVSEQAEAETEGEESDEDQPADEDAEDSEDETETLTIDGEEVTLPKEVAEKVTKVQKRLEADYTRKTQEAAEMRKSAEQLKQRVEQDAVFYQQNTDLLVQGQSIDAQLKEYEGVDWAALAEQDIGAYSKHKEIRDNLRAQHQQIWQEFGQRQTFLSEQKAAEHKQQRDFTVETVKRAIPDYFEKYDNKVVGVAETLATKHGLTLDKAKLKELSNDPLVVLALVELSKYHDLIAKRPESAKKVAAAPAKLTVKPHKSSTQSREQKIKSLLSQGRIREAAAL